jgi:hypothetical protein
VPEGGVFLPTSAVVTKVQSNGADFATSPLTMSAIVVLVIAALAVILAIALAYVPLRLLVDHIARNIREFIQRERERRTIGRESADRRKAAP